MIELNKGKSPFYPGQPVPAELFVGRRDEINRLVRAVEQVRQGKPQAVFLTGEYGIGKSSLAGFVRQYAEQNSQLIGVHAFLGGARTVDDIAFKIVEAFLKQQVYQPTIAEKIRNGLSRYVGEQELFGVKINLEAIRADAPSLAHGFLPFVAAILKRLEADGVKGVVLVLDEINGIADNPDFAHFIKSLVDENALSRSPVPILLLLCGVEDRWKQMIENHQPIERVFDIVQIDPMREEEMARFFEKAFETVGVIVDSDAMGLLCHYSAGFPKIMHTIGEEVFFINTDNVIDKKDTMAGIFRAAESIGRKFIDQQVLRALKSQDYHSILAKMAKGKFDLAFKKTSLEKELTESERKKFNNFLQKMKKLQVLKSGEEMGEYVFNSRLVKLYMLLVSLEKEKTPIK
jgi:hypothetical protein